MKRIIPGIEPFNNFFFISCFYNSLFPALKFYYVDIMSILTNYVPNYYVENPADFFVKYDAIDKEEDVLNRNGLKYIYLEKNDDLEKFVKSSIDSNTPVIVTIDWYYMRNQVELFEKVHRFHTVLVIGYDDVKRNYLIFDERHADTLSYELCEIAYEDLKKANDAYTQLFANHTEPGGWQICKNNSYEPVSDKSIDYAEVYKNKIATAAVWEKRIGVLEKVKENIGPTLIQQFNDNLVEHIVDNLNDIVNHKRVEKYIANQLIQNTEMSKNIDHIIDCWSLIRNKILKCSFAGCVNKNVIQIVQAALNDIVRLEREVLKSIMQ